MEKDEALGLLSNLSLVNLATIDGDQPRVRAVTLVAYDDQFWISTRTSADKMGQIRANDKVELNLSVGSDRDFGTVRATGRVEVIDDEAVKSELAGQMPFFNMIFKSIDDPDYTLLRLDLSRIKVLYPYKNEMFAFDL
ncbi:MAG: pyridoxamine 5'-phosphate oxidase family protein [Methanomassiliicoccales archaeon]|nr:pyridoxamine 5'-phosphate oxidase family protein [Methanomassiliicoccales archaeon]NYT16062.1 pyridoxamine 5'-phosphate oxidase family protein [Methanomassiliicoccales archaeon]